MNRRVFIKTALSTIGGMICATALPQSLFAKPSPTHITLGPGSTLKNLDLSNCLITMDGSYQTVTCCTMKTAGQSAIIINCR